MIEIGVFLVVAVVAALALLFVRTWRNGGGRWMVTCLACGCAGVIALQILMFLTDGRPDREPAATVHVDTVTLVPQPRGQSAEPYIIDAERPVSNVAAPRGDSRDDVESTADVNPPSDDESVPSTGEPETAWSKLVEQDFQAELYPSPRSAVRSLAHTMLALVDDLVPEGASPSVVEIRSTVSGCRDRDLLAGDFAGVVREALTDARVTIETNQEDLNTLHEAGGIDVTLRIGGIQTGAAPWAEGEYQTTAPLIAELRGRRGNTVISTRFVEKPWVEDFEQFLAERPGRQFLLIRSKHFAHDTTESHAVVNDAAAAALIRPLRPYAFSAWRSRTTAGFPEGELESLVKQEVARGNAITDRFVQKLTRPYGDVYREAALIDPNSRSFTLLTTRVSQHFARSSQRHVQVRRHEISIFGTLGAVLCLLVTLYLVLNAVTKGYYRSRLVPALFGAAVLAVLVAAVVRAGGI